jgi:O-acetyl-ADP-ribose deacetylase (regulator of RNase III)
MTGVNMRVVTDTIVEQQVDMLINSANTFLIMGSGTAEQIRDVGGYIPYGSNEHENYWELVRGAKGALRDVLSYVHANRPIPSVIQKECLEIVIRGNGSKELKRGDAILTSSGDLEKLSGGAKSVAHAIAMTYDWKVQPNPPVIPATFELVRRSLEKSFEIATWFDYASIALPIMCTRKGGLTKEVSTEATLQALQILNNRDSKVKEAVIVLYNDELKKDVEWFKKAFRN